MMHGQTNIKLVLDIWQEILSGIGAGLLSKQDHTV